eukprot:28953_4
MTEPYFLLLRLLSAAAPSASLIFCLSLCCFGDNGVKWDRLGSRAECACWPQTALQQHLHPVRQCPDVHGLRAGIWAA